MTATPETVVTGVKRQQAPVEITPGAKRHEGTALSALKTLTTVVADSGDYEEIKKYLTEDATTNPSLILQAVKKAEYQQLVQDCIASVDRSEKDEDDLVNTICEGLLFAFGKNILNVVPGRVSVEVDAKLSFDIKGSITMAKRLVEMFEAEGIKRDRLLIKLAATWEGCQAACQLQQEGINCNLTLIFSKAQAIAAAEAGAFLISPFVGRILDWYTKSTGQTYDAPEDPGVQSVKAIYTYYKKHGFKTIVMGASFRNVGEILELAGCDRLTISPALLKELEEMPAGKVEKKLDAEDAGKESDEVVEPMTEKRFRWELNEDQMATEKLSEGIRKFHADWATLKELVRNKL